MKRNQKKDIIQDIYNARFEKLDNIIIEKIRKIEATSEEERIGKKYAIIMEEMYKQGFKDGINLIIECQNKSNNP